MAWRFVNGGKKKHNKTPTLPTLNSTPTEKYTSKMKVKSRLFKRYKRKVTDNWTEH